MSRNEISLNLGNSLFEIPNESQFKLISQVDAQNQSQCQNIFDFLRLFSSEYSSLNPRFLSLEMFNKNLFSRQLKCIDSIRQQVEPLLGLNYIIEFQFENQEEPSQYICELCQIKCSSVDSMIIHVKNMNHRRKYLKTKHPELYEKVLSSARIRNELEEMINICAHQIEIMGMISGEIKLNLELKMFNEQKSNLIELSFDRKKINSDGNPNLISSQLVTKTFDEYLYDYDENFMLKKTSNNLFEKFKEPKLDEIQNVLTSEDFFYPFDRQFWYENYKDLLQSRPIDPHSVIYEENMSETTNFQSFKIPSLENKSSTFKSSSTKTINENSTTIPKQQRAEQNSQLLSNRRVIFDSNRTSVIIENGISNTVYSKDKNHRNIQYDHQKNNSTTIETLNEQSALAILAANGLSCKENGLCSSVMMKRNNQLNFNADQKLSPETAKCMLEAVLNGELDVSNIQPYFSTFVDLIRSGQVELERNQAEQLLHKVLVNPPATIKDGSIITNRKRLSSYSSECSTPSAASSMHQYEETYNPSEDSNMNDSMFHRRRVHVVSERNSKRKHRLFE